MLIQKKTILAQARWETTSELRMSRQKKIHRVECHTQLKGPQNKRKERLAGASNVEREMNTIKHLEKDSSRRISKCEENTENQLSVVWKMCAINCDSKIEWKNIDWEAPNENMKKKKFESFVFISYAIPQSERFVSI